MNSVIRTHSGIYFDLSDPQPEQVEIEDIIAGLSYTCRFGGQVNCLYSVAAHSVLCAAVAAEDGLPKEAVLAALMHDAAEAYVGDMPKPLKNLLPEFQRIEDRIAAAIRAKYSISAEFDAEIKAIDEALLIAERRVLFSPDGMVWPGEESVRLIPDEMTERVAWWKDRYAGNAFRSAVEDVEAYFRCGCWAGQGKVSK